MTTWDVHAVVNAMRDAPWPSEVKLLLYPLVTRCGGSPSRVISLDRLVLDTGLSRSTLQRWIKAADALFLEVFGVPLTTRTEGGAHLFDLSPLGSLPKSSCDPCQIDTRVKLTWGGGQIDLGGEVKLTPIKQARKKDQNKEEQQAAHARTRTQAGAAEGLALLAAAPPSFLAPSSGSSLPWIRGVIHLLPQALHAERGIEDVLGAYSEAVARAAAMKTARAAAKGGLRSPLAYLRSCLERIKAEGVAVSAPGPQGGKGQGQRVEAAEESLASLHARFEAGEDIGEGGELRLWPELAGQGMGMREMLSWGAVFPPPMHKRSDHV